MNDPVDETLDATLTKVIDGYIHEGHLEGKKRNDVMNVVNTSLAKQVAMTLCQTTDPKAALGEFRVFVQDEMHLINLVKGNP